MREVPNKKEGKAPNGESAAIWELGLQKDRIVAPQKIPPRGWNFFFSKLRKCQPPNKFSSMKSKSGTYKS